jgi:hypothetical protein
MEAMATIGLVISCLSLLATIYLGLFRMARIEARVDIIWTFILRQGVASSILGGLVERNSPLRFNVGALQRHQDFVARLQDWYTPARQRLRDLELFVELESSFSKEFTAICEEEKVLPGGCTAAAMFLLRPATYKEYETKDWEKPA